MKRKSIPGAARQAAQTAGALLEALANEDSKGVESAVIRAQLLARMNGVDSWTQERLEVLDAVASAFGQGTGGVGALRLLAHVACDPVNRARLM